MGKTREAAEGSASATDADQPKKPGIAEAVRLAIPLGVAVITGLLVVLGLEGDARSRFIRDEPMHLFWILAFVIVGVAFPSIVAGFRTPPEPKTPTTTREKFKHGWPEGLGSILVVIAAILTALWGTEAVANREQPDITVAAQNDATPDLVNVQVTATGLSLRPKDKMLVRVVAIKPIDETKPAVGVNSPRLRQDVCFSATQPWNEDNIPENFMHPGRTIYWGETGPTSKGDTEASVNLQVSRAEFRWVCVYAVLTSRTAPNSSSAKGPATITETVREVPGPTESTSPTSATEPAKTTADITNALGQLVNKSNQDARTALAVVDLRNAAPAAPLEEEAKPPAGQAPTVSATSNPSPPK